MMKTIGVHPRKCAYKFPMYSPCMAGMSVVVVIERAAPLEAI
jgi:hypothetical protein